MGVLLAALVHEAGHILAIRVLGERIIGIRIGCFGAEITVMPMEHWQELLCALAGPVSGLLILPLFPWFPCTAAAALVQSLWNLLPVYPLDGGRILRSILRLLGLGHFVNVVESCLLLLVMVGIGFVSFRLGMGICSILVIFCLVSFLWGKIPCKRGRKGLQ